MKQFFVNFCIVVFLLSTSCTREEHGSSEEKLFSNEIELQESSLTIEQAIKNMNYVYSNVVDSGHKQRHIHDINLLTISDIPNSLSTRTTTEETEDIPLAYIVNFENESGYAILAADSKLPPIIMLGDSGNFCINKYINFLQGNTTRNQDELTDMEYIQYMMITNSFIFGPTLPTAPINCRDTVVLMKCLPLVTTKWGQRSPYNYYAKNEENQTCAAGCVPIACAQTLASLNLNHNFVPTVEIDENYPVNWSLLHSDLSNGVYKYNSNDNSTNALNAASLIRALGTETEAEYGVAQTLALPSRFDDILMRIGCDTARYRYKDYVSNSDLYTMIAVKDYPVTTSAVSYKDPEQTTIVGHAFVLDGWMKLEYTYDSNTINIGGSVTELKGQFDLVHVNFGWNGYSDGYYLPQSFNITSDEFRKYMEENDVPLYYNYNFDMGVYYVMYDI